MADVQGQQQDDQSMEEILQSIRRIIAEENDDPAAQAQPREEDDVLELTEIIEEEAATPPAEPEAAPAAAAVESVPVDGDILNSIDAILQEDTPAVAPKPIEASPQAEPEMPETPQPNTPKATAAPSAQADDPGLAAEAGVAEELLSSTAAAQAAAALSELRNLPEPQPQPSPRESASLRSGGTVEDLVVEALRPMLKDWLDANLPDLVRELVEREIRKLRA